MDKKRKAPASSILSYFKKAAVSTGIKTPEKVQESDIVSVIEPEPDLNDGNEGKSTASSSVGVFISPNDIGLYIEKQVSSIFV